MHFRVTIIGPGNDVFPHFLARDVTRTPCSLCHFPQSNSSVDRIFIHSFSIAGRYPMHSVINFKSILLISTVFFLLRNIPNIVVSYPWSVISTNSFNFLNLCSPLLLGIEEPPNRLLSDVLFLPPDRFEFCLSASLSASSSNSHTVSRKRVFLADVEIAELVVFCFFRAGNRAAGPLCLFRPVPRLLTMIRGDLRPEMQKW